MDPRKSDLERDVELRAKEPFVGNWIGFAATFIALLAMWFRLKVMMRNHCLKGAFVKDAIEKKKCLLDHNSLDFVAQQMAYLSLMMQLVSISRMNILVCSIHFTFLHLLPDSSVCQDRDLKNVGMNLSVSLMSIFTIMTQPAVRPA